MKKKEFHISLYIIVPIIFAGIALLCTIISYNITFLYLKRGLNPEGPIIVFGLAIALLTFICGLVISKLLLDPVEKFIRKTEKLGVLKKAAVPAEQPRHRHSDMGRYAFVLDQVTELLSRVESEQLFPDIIGQNKAIRGVFNQILKVAPTDATVLILGETGTGKELIAKSIHNHSRRSASPFVAINCAAIPEGLLESELFGHEKGAFTNADRRKLGKFEAANGGTIFLDEIGDMPLDTQAKVLRVLQDSQIERVGGLQPIAVDVRFIAATNKKLQQMVEVGKFREDLFYRLNGFTIYLPPLRERPEDIPALVSHFITKEGRDLTVDPAAMQLLTAHGWPGNIRELENVVKSAGLLASDHIRVSHLPGTLRQNWHLPDTGSDTDALPPKPGSSASLDDQLRDLEKGIIIEALTRAAGVQVEAAKILGIKEKSFRYRVKKLGIDAPAIKAANKNS